ncbi:hypothetical protein, partial [Kitasatospora albolonga]|uniref:hypothetical protein n=1 Tax=Kitasatospora albolonga TaxID=68173 RepID=UPI0035E4AE2B
SLPDVFRPVSGASFIQLACVFCDLTARPTFQTLTDTRLVKRIRPDLLNLHTTNQTDPRQGASQFE